MALTQSEIVILQKRQESPRRLHSALYQLNTIPSEGLDVILIEGFKGTEYPYPAIVVCSSPEDILELQETNPEIILITGTISPEQFTNDLAKWKSRVVPISDVPQLWEKFSEVALEYITGKLPGKDCDTCGFPTCKEFAKALWNKTTKFGDCAQLEGDIVVEIDGKIVPLVGFVQQIIGNGITGMLTALKGVPPGLSKINISIKR